VKIGLEMNKKLVDICYYSLTAPMLSFLQLLYKVYLSYPIMSFSNFKSSKNFKVSLESISRKNLKLCETKLALNGLNTTWKKHTNP